MVEVTALDKDLVVGLQEQLVVTLGTFAPHQHLVPLPVANRRRHEKVLPVVDRETPALLGPRVATPEKRPGVYRVGGLRVPSVERWFPPGLEKLDDRGVASEISVRRDGQLVVQLHVHFRAVEHEVGAVAADVPVDCELGHGGPLHGDVELLLEDVPAEVHLGLDPLHGVQLAIVALVF